MPEIQIPGIVTSLLQVIIAFVSAFGLALWISLVVWTFRDARARSRDFFAVLLATLMVVIFGPLGLLLYFLLRPQVTLAELYERSLEEEALLQDLEERPRCSGCSRVVEEAWIICPDCHTQLKRVCQNCNYKLHMRWNICPSCATPVNQAAQVAHTYARRSETIPFPTPAAAPASVERPVSEAEPEREPEPEAELILNDEGDEEARSPLSLHSDHTTPMDPSEVVIEQPADRQQSAG